MPLALYILTAGAFGIGVTEFAIMGLLLEVSRELGVTIAAAGLLIAGYALGVTVGAPIFTVPTASISLAADGPTTAPATACKLTFSGEHGIVIPPGAPAINFTPATSAIGRWLQASRLEHCLASEPFSSTD